ncbi:MAG: 3-dehydroquinate synthase [Treponema sp.]|nr:3-dehydroquinate synthase [Treponema sp.]
MIRDVLHSFTFKGKTSSVLISQSIPDLERLSAGYALSQSLVVCDTNTKKIAASIPGINHARLCVIRSGEDAKNWQSVEQILRAAAEAGIGRDGLFIGIGGGVVTDLTAFAAAIYMRGIAVRLVSTTVLGMVDASVGGKTGFDFLGIKNLVGAFHPADEIFMPLSVLETLPASEWKSGFAEILKTGILADPAIIDILQQYPINFDDPDFLSYTSKQEWLSDIIHRCVAAKGKIVESDPEETGTERTLLNLGHTYGHALEAVAGLGTVSHGEAVAWGIGRACALGELLGITPKERTMQIVNLLEKLGYCTTSRYPLSFWDPEKIIQAMYSDKKKQQGKLRFIIPAAEGAVIKTIDKSDIDLVLKTLG